MEKKCKYPIEFQKNNLEAYVAVEYTTDQRGYIVKKKVVACDNKKFKKITLDIFDEVKTLKIATTEKIDTIYFQYKIQGSPTLIHSKVDVKIIGYGYYYCFHFQKNQNHSHLKKNVYLNCLFYWTVVNYDKSSYFIKIDLLLLP